MNQRLLSINNYHYRRGGADIVFLEQNAMFERIGWDVIPFSMRHEKNIPTPWDPFFVDEIEFGKTYGPLDKLRNAGKVIYSTEARDKLRRLIDIAPPTVAHAHSVYHHLSPAIFSLLKEAGVPLVMSVHDLKLACPAYTMLRDGQPCERCRGGRVHNAVLNRCIKGSLALSALVATETVIHRLLGLYAGTVDRFVVPSRFYIDKLVEWGWDRGRFQYLPNFVDTDALRPAPGAGRGFVYFGRLSPEKGVDTLIRAAALAKAPLSVVGTGPAEAALRALAETVGADVSFLGYRTGGDLHDAVRSARAVVLPSVWYENAPVSLMEAYALGKPVIGSRIGGIPELVREGETGCTVPPGNAAALAAALAEMAALPDREVEARGRAGREWMRGAFGPEAYRDRLLALYASLAAAPRTMRSDGFRQESVSGRC